MEINVTFDPAKWKLVPITPTPEMITAGRAHATYWDDGDPAECAGETYAAMLAAVPPDCHRK